MFNVFSLDAEWDDKVTLQDWTTKCFKNYREYSIPADFLAPNPVPKSILEAKDFNEIVDAFNTEMTKMVPKNAYVERIRLAPESKICFMGDIHGSLHSLLRNLLRLVALGYLKMIFQSLKTRDFIWFFLETTLIVEDIALK